MVSFTCPKAADANDNGVVDLSDAIAILGRLFLGDGAAAAAGLGLLRSRPDARWAILRKGVLIASPGGVGVLHPSARAA